MKNIAETRSGFGVLESTKETQTAVMCLGRGEASGPFHNEHPKSVQVLLVHAGSVDAQIGEDRFRMSGGDSCIVPKGVAHRFVGASDEPAITFNVYSPPAY